MSKNRIKKLDFVDQLKTLKLADFSENSIQNIGCLSEPKACPELLHLNLSNNVIFSVNMIKLTNLKYLDISKNNIEKLVNSSLPNLTYLDVSNNQLQTINITELKELTELNLSNNNLTQLFTLMSFEHLPKLQKFDLSHNKIARVEINEGLDMNLKELKTLNLSFNQFDLIEHVTIFNNTE